MEQLNYKGTTYHLPGTNQDVSGLITQAIEKNRKIRVRGSGHSFPPEIILQTPPKDSINVILSKMRKVTFGGTPPKPVPPLYHDKKYTLVTVQGGCNLGLDPFDITGISTLENSLLYQMQEKKLALPDLGGIMHQSISGFLCMGCSGGSTKYSFDDCIYSITLIAANTKNPQPVTYYCGTDEFNAAAVSMGLLGIIVEVQLLGLPTFNIKGSEMINTVGASTDVNLFNSREPANINIPGIRELLREKEYSRLIWWPQPLYGATDGTFNKCLNDTRFTLWQAKRIEPDAGFKPQPYEEVQPVLGSKALAQFLAGLVFRIIGRCKLLMGLIGKNTFYKKLYTPLILNNFVNISKPKNSKKNLNPQNFWDYWYTGLPMDNQMSDETFPVWFTELWIDINKSEEVMQTLAQIYNNYYNREKYNEDGKNPLIPNGAFSVEIYAAKASHFWLSPAYEQDVIRIDAMWFGRNKSDPSKYFEMFWKEMKKFNFKAHWAKYQPDYSSKEWQNYLKVYDKLSDFLKIRQAHDPQNVFLNDYWKKQLGL